MYKKIIKKYLSETSGNIAIMSALTAGVVVLAAGGVIDISQLQKDQSNARDISDASVLAAALEFNRTGNSRVGRKAAASLEGEHTFGEVEQENYKIKTTIKADGYGGFDVTTTVNGTTQHNFLGMIGRNETSWEVVSKSHVGLLQAEIVLALDVSQSMLNNSKFPNMQNAAVSFIEGLEPFDEGNSYVNVSILPFAENVNMGVGSESLLDNIDGYDHSPNFVGCFRHSDGRSYGDLQAYSDGSAPSGNPFCPPTSSASVLFSSDEAALVDMINGLGVGYGTGTDVAMRWVNRVLDPAWRSQMTWSATPPKTFKSQTRKYVVLLSDGRVTRADPDQNGINNTQNPEDVPDESQPELDEFIAQCEKLKNQGDINLYTIGYSPSGNLNATFEAALQNCISGSGRFYAAGTANIEEIFNAIQEDLSEIYITQ